MNTNTTNDGGPAFPCEHCSGMNVSGTFTPHPTDKGVKNFKVQSGAINLGYFNTIEMARAGACGTEGAVILERQKEAQA